MSDTPETDAFQQTDQCAYDSMWRGFARKLERERDEARFDLEFRRELYAFQELRLSNTIRPKEEAAGLLDKANIALRVKWVNALRAIVGSTMPKNKSGVSLVSDIDLILASDEQRLMALEKIK
jgi:hypothetical protein